MTNEELNAIRKGYRDAYARDNLTIPWAIRWVMQQVPGLVAEVERLTQELDQARAVINQVSIELMRMSAVNDEHAIEAHNLLSQYLWELEHPKADANAREDTPE